MTRLTATIAGRVQGVGFRFTAQRIARAFAVTGYVRNLPDGNVLLVAEGEREELDAFLGAVRERMTGNIDQVDRCTSGATGEFTSMAFEIRR